MSGSRGDGRGGGSPGIGIGSGCGGGSGCSPACGAGKYVRAMSWTFLEENWLLHRPTLSYPTKDTFKHVLRILRLPILSVAETAELGMTVPLPHPQCAG
jgi:hypothetical protein